MTAQELRIGNWVRETDEGRPIRINRITPKTVSGENLAAGILFAEAPFNAIAPIELTPERLEKCGFRHLPMDENDNYREPREDSAERERYAFQIGNNVWLEYVKDNGIDAQTGQPVTWWEWHINSEFYDADLYFWHQPKYLHHLQNLIYDLTNQELTVTPQSPL